MKMQLKSIITSVFIAGILSLTACDDDLNIVQESYITSTSMWLTEGDATSGMYGMYNRFRNAFYDYYVYYGDYRSGLYGEGIIADDNMMMVANNQISRSVTGTDWTNIYTTVNDANILLKHTPNISFIDETMKNVVLSNGYFVRAFCYFWLTRIWGDVPLLTEGFQSDAQDIFPSRSTASAVYAQIESDLNTADNLMPEGISSRTIANKAAIKMLKADYYLWMAKTQNGGNAALENARSAVDYVLSLTNLGLLPSFKDVFYTENNKEIIFAINLLQNEVTGGYPAVYLVPTQYVTDQSLVETSVKVGSHQEYVCVTSDYQNFIYSDSRDQRANTSCATYVDQVNDEHFRWINKYSGTWTNNTRYFDSDIVIYRYAEALMFKAEIENALGNTPEAISFLNNVAERSYGLGNFYDSNLSRPEVDELLIDEYLKEFVVEGKSWWVFNRFDVVYDRVESLAGRENEHANMLIWPVSTATLSGNTNIKQTEGYN